MVRSVVTCNSVLEHSRFYHPLGSEETGMGKDAGPLTDTSLKSSLGTTWGVVLLNICPGLLSTRAIRLFQCLHKACLLNTATRPHLKVLFFVLKPHKAKHKDERSKLPCQRWHIDRTVCVCVCVCMVLGWYVSVNKARMFIRIFVGLQELRQWVLEEHIHSLVLEIAKPFSSRRPIMIV